MEPSHWSQLPHTAIINVFSHLSHKDRARASSTCKSWRDCYFHPSFWRCVDLELTIQSGCEPVCCILDKCGKFVRELCLTCSADQPRDVFLRTDSACAPAATGSEESLQENQLDNIFKFRKLYQGLPKVLQGLQNCEGLEKLILSVFPLHKNFTSADEDFESKMAESWKKVIPASSKLKTLALAHSIGSLPTAFLTELSDEFGKQLQVLHIPTFQASEEVTDEAITKTLSLSKFTSLSILTLSPSTVTEPLLKSLLDSKCASPLQQLNMVVGLSDVVTYLDDASWSKLGRRLPDLEVTVSAVILDSKATDELQHYLTPSIPLTSLRIYVSRPWSLTEDLMDSISKNYSSNLRCLEIHTDKATLLFGNNSEADPLVMLCWQCKKLKHLVISGYKLLICNVLAIATLRGPALTTFDVERDLLYSDHEVMWASEEYDEETQTSHDSFYSDSTFSDSLTSETEYRHTLIQDVSSSLKRPWEPVERRHMTLQKFLNHDLLIDVDQ